MQSSQPSQPTRQPSSTIKQPSMRPSRQPSSRPSSETTCQPAISPTIMPSSQPSSKPSKHPSVQTSTAPLAQLSRRPSIQPFSMQPSKLPSSVFNVLQTATVIQMYWRRGVVAEGSFTLGLQAKASNLAGGSPALTSLIYSVLSFGLEPSCWSTDNYTTECEFPTVTDADQYRLLLTI